MCQKNDDTGTVVCIKYANSYCWLIMLVLKLSSQKSKISQSQQQHCIRWCKVYIPSWVFDALFSTHLKLLKISWNRQSLFFPDWQMIFCRKQQLWGLPINKNIAESWIREREGWETKVLRHQKWWNATGRTQMVTLELTARITKAYPFSSVCSVITSAEQKKIYSYSKAPISKNTLPLRKLQYFVLFENLRASDSDLTKWNYAGSIRWAVCLIKSRRRILPQFISSRVILS